PAYYHINDDLIVAASERSAIRTVFNLEEQDVLELMPGQALIVSKVGQYRIEQILEPAERRACSFERIYFSRGSDQKIYRERIQLGRNLSDIVLKAIDYDLRNTIFSFIPNTAETAFYGLIKGAEDYLNTIKTERIMSWGTSFSEEKLSEMISRRIRIEKIAIKDVKLRTFITEDKSRNELVQHVYDITYGTVRKNEDSLVIIDDSIVRGTTLKESIIRMLSRLEPKQIILVSSAPQIRYPDCYGIDMSILGDFIAFRAAIALLEDSGQSSLLAQLKERILQLKQDDLLHTENLVKQIYKPFTTEQLSDKIASLITPPDIRIPVQVIYQTIESLHAACPGNTGDWYFTGNYPTPGGNRVCNVALLNYLEGKNQRGY
ncbi:MAG: amidophosphoribosyltransferase, partial [Ferruginibacter sp.]